MIRITTRLTACSKHYDTRVKAKLKTAFQGNGIILLYFINLFSINDKRKLGNYNYIESDSICELVNFPELA